MVRVKYQARVKHLRLVLGGRRAAHLEQEAGGQPQAFAGGRQFAAAARGVLGGDQHRLLRGQPHRLAGVRLRRVRVLVRVVGAGQ